MSKFNIVLNGRLAAKEAALRIQQIVSGSADKEDIVLDFSGVEVVAPGYADELLRTLKNKYNPDSIEVVNTTPAVSEAIRAVSIV